MELSDIAFQIPACISTIRQKWKNIFIEPAVRWWLSLWLWIALINKSSSFLKRLLRHLTPKFILKILLEVRSVDAPSPKFYMCLLIVMFSFEYAHLLASEAPRFIIEAIFDFRAEKTSSCSWSRRACCAHTEMPTWQQERSSLWFLWHTTKKKRDT